MDRDPAKPPHSVSTLTAPTPLLPDTVIPAAQSPHSLGWWGRRLADSPLVLFPMALGASAFGWSTDDRVVAEILDEFIELGGNFVDATGSHIDGRSERAVGGWLARRGSRSRILLGTTIGHQHDLSDRPAPVIVHAVEAALSRLRTEHLDLLSLRLGDESPIDEVLAAVDDLIRAGKVRFVAAAAPSADRLVEARITAAQQGVAQLVAVQANYSLANRGPYESAVSGVVTLQACGFMPRQPLAGGLLASGSRYRQEHGRRLRHGAEVSLPARRWPALLAVLASMAAEQSVAVPAIALAWLLTRPNVTAPIVSVSRAGQLTEAIAAVRVQLTRNQVAELDRLSR